MLSLPLWTILPSENSEDNATVTVETRRGQFRRWWGPSISHIKLQIKCLLEFGSNS